MNTTAIMTAIVMIATGILGTATMSGTAFAQEIKDPGASGLAPDENPRDPSFDPHLAPDDSPGNLKCNELKCSAGEDNPGKKGLESGIIGPH